VGNWEERQRLLEFIAEIERRIAGEEEIAIAGSPLSDWIVWAKERAEALDPFDEGVAGVFDAISKVSQWS
jgi:hypothetical protein